MKIRLLNKTTGNYVRDADSEDGAICEFEFMADAVKSLERVIEIKRSNAGRRNDKIVICYCEAGQPVSEA